MSKIVFEKDFARHPLHYFVLLCAQLIGLWGMFWFSHDSLTQFAIIIYMTVAYLVWGIFHHHQHRDLHLKIVLEYLLFAVLAVLLLGSLIFRL